MDISSFLISVQTMSFRARAVSQRPSADNRKNCSIFALITLMVPLLQGKTSLDLAFCEGKAYSSHYVIWENWKFTNIENVLILGFWTSLLTYA